MNNYEVFSGNQQSVCKAHIQLITNYKEAERIMLREFKKPEIKEVLIMKNEEPFEYMSDKGRFRV